MRPALHTLFVERCPVQDVVLQFFVPFNHPVTHELVSDNRSIALRYMKSWFFVDFISIFPWDLVGSGDPNASRLALFRVVRLLRLAKLLRVVRANRILSRWRNRFGIAHSTLSLMKFFLLIILVSHWSACIFHLTAAIQEDIGNLNWVRVQFGRCEQHAFVEDCLREDIFLEPIQSPFRDGMRRYLASLYWSVATIATIGYGDIIPETDAERAVALLTMLMGGGVYAYIVGAVYGIVSTMDRATMEYNAHMDHLNKFMEEIHYPDDGRFIIRAYFDAFKRLFRQQYYQGLLTHLSPALRQKVALHMHAEWLNSIPYFNAPNKHEREDFITSIAVVLQPRLYAPLETILRLGYINRHLFIIQRGLAIVRTRVVGAGQFFGDTWILTNGRCTDSVRSITYLYVMTLSQQSLNETLETGNFEATRRMIRKSLIRLALRREFLKCAALARLQRRVLRRLTAAEAAAKVAAGTPGGEGGAPPPLGRTGTVTASGRDILGGLSEEKDRAQTVLSAIGGAAGRNMLRLDREVEDADSSLPSATRSLGGHGASNPLASDASATPSGSLPGRHAQRPVSGSARLAAAAAAAMDRSSPEMSGSQKTSPRSDYGEVSSVGTQDDLGVSARSPEPEGHAPTIASLGAASSQPSVLIVDEATRQALAERWQQLHEDMPLLARIMTRASLPKPADTASGLQRAAAGALLGIPGDEELDESTLTNPNYSVTARGRRTVQYRLRSRSTLDTSGGDALPERPPLAMGAVVSRSDISGGPADSHSGHVGLSPVPLSSQVLESGPPSPLAASGASIAPAMVRLGSQHKLPRPATASLDVQTAVNLMSGGIPATSLLTGRTLSSALESSDDHKSPVHRMMDRAGREEGPGDVSSPLTQPSSPADGGGSNPASAAPGRPPLSSSTSVGASGFPVPGKRRAVRLQVKSSSHLGGSGLIDDSSAQAAPKQHPPHTSEDGSRRGGFSDVVDTADWTQAPSESGHFDSKLDSKALATLPRTGSVVSANGTPMVSATTVLHKLTETLTAVTHSRADSSREIARVRSQITSIFMEVRTLRWLVVSLLLITCALMVLVVLLMAGQ